MSYANTTRSQDKEISEAESGQQHISNLIAIINDLDNQITEWKEATGCSTPDEAVDKIFDLECTLENVQGVQR